MESAGWAYVALQLADLELLEGLAGLVAVADILEGLGGVLAGNVEEDLLTTAIEQVALARVFWASSVCLVSPRGGPMRGTSGESRGRR